MSKPRYRIFWIYAYHYEYYECLEHERKDTPWYDFAKTHRSVGAIWEGPYPELFIKAKNLTP